MLDIRLWLKPEFVFRSIAIVLIYNYWLAARSKSDSFELSGIIYQR